MLLSNLFNNAPNNQVLSQGFSLLELLASLFLATLLALGNAHYQLASQALANKMQQETLASALLDKLFIHSQLHPAASLSLADLAAGSPCPSLAAATAANWCLALNQLPNLRLTSGSGLVTLEWQTPKGLAKLSRPAWAN